jgi:hypothetical protein
MADIPIKSRKRTNHTIPSKPMTPQEFAKWIDKAEKAPVINATEFKAKWKKKLKSIR